MYAWINTDQSIHRQITQQLIIHTVPSIGFPVELSMKTPFFSPSSYGGYVPGD